MRAHLVQRAAVVAALLVPLSVDAQGATGGGRPAGVIAGHITDSRTGEGIELVSVTITGANLANLTGQDGRYQIRGVPAGTHTLIVRRIGYAKSSTTVSVSEGQEVQADFRLTVTANKLAEVVTTGTVESTERKQLTTAISVIGADEIKKKNVAQVGELFRGAVPGAYSWDQGAYNYYTQFGSIRGSTSVSGGVTFKTYLDGVEIVNPAYIAQIDPNSIERIEVVRGPQASTMYGSEAMNGVMQIFTKKGMFSSARPQLDLKLSGGRIARKWTNESASVQAHALTVSGGGADFSYQFGGTYDVTGSWAPEMYAKNAGANGSVRMTQGRFTADLSARRAYRDWGWPLNPLLRDAGYSYWQKPRDEQDQIRQSTYGANLAYQATPEWRHNLTLGQDVTQFAYWNRKPRFLTPADSGVSVYTSDVGKSSIGYNTTIDVPLSADVTSSLTVGGDYWVYNSVSAYVDAANSNTAARKSYNNNYSLTRYQWGNTGLFAQTKIGFADRLFVQMGVRRESNDNFGPDYGAVTAPRFGITYVHEAGDFTLKPRFSWGKAIKPPSPIARMGALYSSARYLPNEAIGPEMNSGSELGLDVAAGTHFSLGVTYYDQTAQDLIDNVRLGVDSATKLQLYQAQNVGIIKNRGWETEATITFPYVMLQGTYSAYKSTVAQLSPTYRGELQVGDKMLQVPVSSAGATLTLTPARATSVALGMSYVGPWTSSDWLSLYGFYYGGQTYRGSQRAYWLDYQAITKFNLSVSQELDRGLSVFGRVDNLTNNYQPEQENTFFAKGRQTVLGIRWRI